VGVMDASSARGGSRGHCPHDDVDGDHDHAADDAHADDHDLGGGNAHGVDPSRATECLGVLGCILGDHRLRIYALPLSSAINSAQNGASAGGEHESLVIQLSPRLITAPGPGPLMCFCWSPHDPTLLIAGLADGSAALYRIDPDAVDVGGNGSGNGEGGAEAEGAWMTPVRRFMDGRGVGPPGTYAPTTIEWCPVAPEVFAMAGWVG
jgi:hypothetical protein